MNMTENTEPQLSEQDIADLEALGVAPEPEVEQRSVLTLWRHIFSNVAEVRQQRVPMNTAMTVVSNWPKLSYQDVPVYHDVYHAYLEAAGEFLNEIPAEAFSFVGEDDGKENAEVYFDLLVDWHVYLDSIKESWNAADEDSHITLAALVDAGGFIFNATGLSGHLAAIGFQIDEPTFVAAVQAKREG